MRNRITLIALLIAHTAQAAATFGGRCDTWISTNVSSATTIWTITNGVSSGKVAVLFLGWEASSKTISSIIDSKTNTWVVNQQRNVSTVHNAGIASSVLSATLVANDTITITWNSAASFQNSGCLVWIDGANRQPTVSDQTNNYGTAVSFSTVGKTNSGCVLALVNFEQDATLSDETWSQSTPRQEFGHSDTTVGLVNYLFYTNSASTTDVSFSGTISDNKTHIKIWAFYDYENPAPRYFNYRKP